MSNTESPATVEVQTDPSIVVVEGEDRIHAISTCTVGPPGARGAPGPSAFEQAVEEGFEGTFEEWIDTLRGEDGEDGSPGLSAYEIALQQGFEGTEEEWLDFLRGEPGEDGIDGEEVELRSDGTHIQWKYADEVMWNNLVPLEDLRGPAGNDGREVELQVSETHIQWRHAGDVAWTDLISLESLRGPAGQDGSDGEDGDPGADGKSAYEIALENGFEGNEAEWLASLKGDPGLDGENGREVELQTSATHVQWRYVGDNEWNDLVALSEITGPAGDPGSDGNDGASVELRKTDTHLQWRNVGDAEWIDIVALSEITPEVEGFLTKEMGDQMYLRISGQVLVPPGPYTLTEPGFYLIFNFSGTPAIEITMPSAEDNLDQEIFLANTPFGFSVIYPASGETIDGVPVRHMPPGSYMGYRGIELPIELGGGFLWGGASRAGIEFDVPPFYDSSTGTSLEPGFVEALVDNDGISVPTWIRPKELDTSDLDEGVFGTVPATLGEALEGLKTDVDSKVTGAGGLIRIEKITESEYSALDPADPDTLYVVVPDP